jgi:hypothetical protein
MGDNIIDLVERRFEAEDKREAIELERRVDRAMETFGRYLVVHAAEMLAYDVLTHDDRVMDHVWYLRHSYREAILEWARLICPDWNDDEEAA